MVRQYFPDAPMSRLAAWAGRCAFFALAVAALSVIILRSGLLEIVPALATFAAALVLAALAVLLGFAAFIVIWRQGLRGLGSAIAGIMFGTMLLVYPAYLGYRASKLPMINDVTTDPVNPPRFDVLARQRPRGHVDYPGTVTAERQRTAYPDVVPLQEDVPPKTAYDIALAVTTKRKWQVADARDGVIEATARTAIMGFRDDIVIRVSPLGNGTRVDVRSASRVGLHDFGANASRVRTLLEDLDDAIAAAPDPKAEAEKKLQPAPKRPAPKR
jgi:uncharacterized protein (DUF1499 family)